jgi:hypothetical protein
VRSRSELIAALRGAGIDHTLLGGAGGWALLAPALGARVLGAGIGEENALWSAPTIGRRPWAEGGNVGGQRTWIAPEGGPHGFFYTGDPSGWKVPDELDPGDYQAIPDTDGWSSWRSAFTARCLDGDSFPIALTRSVRMHAPREEAAGAHGSPPVVRVELRNTLVNLGDAVLDRRVGLWCITQCPCPESGRILIALESGHRHDCVHPYFEPLPDGVLAMEADAAVLSTRTGVKYKAGCGAAAASGAIAFIGGRGERGFFVALRFPVDRAGTYIDRPFFGGPVAAGDPVQAYNDPGAGPLAFCEIEAHAPCVRLEPGESRSFALQISMAFGAAEAIEQVARREIA